MECMRNRHCILLRCPEWTTNTGVSNMKNALGSDKSQLSVPNNRLRGSHQKACMLQYSFVLAERNIESITLLLLYICVQITSPIWVEWWHFPRSVGLWAACMHAFLRHSLTCMCFLFCRKIVNLTSTSYIISAWLRYNVGELAVPEDGPKMRMTVLVAFVVCGLALEMLCV
jgi:hypothetical protein